MKAAHVAAFERDYVVDLVWNASFFGDVSRVPIDIGDRIHICPLWSCMNETLTAVYRFLNFTIAVFLVSIAILLTSVFRIFPIPAVYSFSRVLATAF